MKQSVARSFIICSLIFSVLSLILSLIALNLPNWKFIRLRSSFTSIPISESNAIDPLIRSEVDKFTEILYRREEIHSFGFRTHCIVGGQCGRNLLPTFHEMNYGLCHNINHHRQCIFSSNTAETNNETKCSCQPPSYMSITYILLILVIILQCLITLINLLRLCRRRQHGRRNEQCPNDFQLRIVGLLCSLLTFLFFILILIQHNGNRLVEPFEFFESMRRHYSQLQIYTFTKDLELILKQIEQSLDIHFGASFILTILAFILLFMAFLASAIVEIKILHKDEKKNIYYHHHQQQQHSNSNNHHVNHNHPPPLPPVPLERYIPSEQIRFIRQTKV